MDGYLADFDAAAPSRAMQDGYAKVQHTVDELLGKLPALDGQAGAAFLLHGKLLGIDLMGSAEAFADDYPMPKALDARIKQAALAITVAVFLLTVWIALPGVAKSGTHFNVDNARMQMAFSLPWIP